MKKFTADDARKMMPRNEQELIDEIVEKAHEKIKEAAEKGRNSIRFSNVAYAYQKPEDVIGTAIARACDTYGYNKASDRESNEAMKALAVLESEGFTVEYYYECRQFVDMGYKISW